MLCVAVAVLVIHEGYFEHLMSGIQMQELVLGLYSLEQKVLVYILQLRLHNAGDFPSGFEAIVFLTQRRA